MARMAIGDPTVARRDLCRTLELGNGQGRIQKRPLMCCSLNQRDHHPLPKAYLNRWSAA